MNREPASRTAIFGICLAVLMFALGAVIPATFATTTAAPPSIRVTAVPQTLPTSNGTRFSAVVVTVIGSTGQPAVAMSNVIVYLASSDTSVLAVQSEVTIPAGHEYALANVTTTLAAGSSTVSALAPGYDGGSALFTTMVPRGYPTALELTALPQMATPGSTGKMAIMVVDQTGEPAQTAAATVVQITSSEPDAVGVLTSKVTIPLGGIVGYGTFAAASVPGSAILTASSPGFNSGATEVTNFVNASAQADQFVSQQPTLQISHILGDLPADGKTYSAMVVSLVNPAANPCPLSGGVAPPTCPYMAPSPVTVLLTSSFPDVAEVPGSVIIPQGGTSAMVNLTTTVTAGFSNITASASDYIPASAKVTTAMMPQVKIGLYVSEPDVLVSQVEHSANVVVQLQDAFGFPVRARAPVSAVLSFSNSTITGFPMDVVVPTGADMVAVNVNLTAAATGTFGVISQGLAAATASFQATMAPISVELSSAHSSMYTNETSALQFTATYDNLPITGLSLSWTATGGSLSNSTTVTGATGTSSVVFKPSGTGVANITVSGNSAAVGPISKHMYIQVLQAQANAKPSILQLLMKYIIYIVPAAGGGAALAFFLIRRRRKGGSSSDEEE